MEKIRSSKFETKCWRRVVFPEPEGAETIYKLPRMRELDF
jgi:hypothetical protein